MKSLTINKRHPVIYFYFITIKITAQGIRTCFICNRPCSLICSCFFFRRSCYHICLSNQFSVFIKPQMLLFNTDLHIISYQIVCTVPLITFFLINRFPGHFLTGIQFCHYLLKLCFLIDLISVFIVFQLNCFSCTGFKISISVDCIIFGRQL